MPAILFQTISNCSIFLTSLQVFADIQEACRAATRLEEIALGKSILSSVAYIERLIDSERRSNRPNKENRLNMFHYFWP